MTQRCFYGSVVLGAAIVIITMAIGTLFTLGVFLRPIEESMGWSRSGIGAIGLFNWIVMGAGGVVSGFVSDRLGTRRPSIPLARFDVFWATCGVTASARRALTNSRVS